jgi:SAM-dependent methyltransferase
MGLGMRFNLRVLIEKLSPYFPLTYTDIVARFLKGCKSILDVGCGNGELMINLRKRINVYSVGLELYLPYLHEAKKRKSHDDFILADARWLPIKPKSFDGVLCSQVLEHLNKIEGLKLLENAEKISKLRVVIGTTIGYIPYLPLEPESDNNPFQVHKSGFMPQFFKTQGYRVRFQGLKLAYGPRGFMRSVPSLLRPLLGLIPYLIAPITYFSSRLAIYLIAYKDIQKTLR